MAYTDIYKFHPSVCDNCPIGGYHSNSLKKMLDEMEIMYLLEHDNPENNEEQRTALLAKAMLVYEIRDRLGLPDIPDEEVAKQYPVGENNE
jgi:Fe-S-cluster containining protein